MEPARVLAAWQTFFFLVGSSGAALTGLQFVVIALISESKRRATSREIEAFATPTILHFCAVLLVSAILSAPWGRMTQVAIVLGVCGLAGLVYSVIVIRRASHQTTYRPVFEDWLWHVAMPMFAYAMLFVAALALTSYPRRILFLVAASALLLLFIGIHNAWDTITYIAVGEHLPVENGETQGGKGQGEGETGDEEAVSSEQ